MQNNFEDQKDKLSANVKKTVRDAMPQVQDIEKDVESLKTNVIGLVRSLKEVSADKAAAAADYVVDQVESFKSTSLETLEKAEERVKSRPAQSMAIAFAAGILASYLLGRRSA